MESYLYLLPLFGFVIGWLTVNIILHFILHYWLPKHQEDIYTAIMRVIRNKLKKQNVLADYIQNLDLEVQVSPILDKKLESLVTKLRDFIPMGHFLLTPTLAEKIQGKIKKEILSTLPEIKQTFQDQLQEQLDIATLIEEFIRSYPLVQLEHDLYRIGKKELRKLTLLGGLIGFGLGLIEVILLMGLFLFFGK